MINQRQFTLKNNNKTNYNRLRNKINRKGKLLRREFYKKKIRSLTEGDNRKWWINIKTLAPNSSQNDDLSSLANHVCDGNIANLVEEINDFFVSISSVESTISQLQDALDKAVQWTRNNDMNINRTKTNIMNITFSKDTGFDPLIIDSEPIETVTTSKLGVTCRVTCRQTSRGIHTWL